MGSKSLKKTIININLTAIITVIKAVTEAVIKAAKSLGKTVYLFVTAIAVNAANRAISQRNTN